MKPSVMPNSGRAAAPVIRVTTSAALGTVNAIASLNSAASNWPALARPARIGIGMHSQFGRLSRRKAAMSSGRRDGQIATSPPRQSTGPQ